MLKYLKKRSDFLRIGQSSLKYSSSFFLVKTASHLNPHILSPSVGYTVTKKIGKAVIRNKIKRQLRRLSQDLKEDFLENHGYIIIIRSGFLTLNFDDMHQHLKKALLYLKRKYAQSKNSTFKEGSNILMKAY